MRFQHVIIIFSLAVLLAGCSTVKHFIEHASFDAVVEDGDFEVRYYETLLLISTSMAKEQGNESSFRKLFAYISGKNSKQQEISMTAPVFMDASKSEKMSFVLPSSFDLDSAPESLDESVSVESLKDLRVAVVRFSGLLSRANIDENTERLKQWLEERDYEISGEAFIAGYDPPSSIPWFRRNEVLIPIR